MKRLVLLALCLLGAVTLRADDPTTFPVGGLTFTRPAAWEWVQVNSPMRKAQLKVPGTKPGESADITFFYFGPQGGGDVQANVQRWAGQFKGPEGATKIETKDIAGSKVTLVTTEGTYTSGGMFGAPTTTQENYALLGAIVENPEGNIFIKMTGPAALVKESHDKFLDFLASAKPVK
jgi:hypothetical protein